MGFNDFFIHNNGDKKQLGDIKHGVRREQLDAKFHPIFDTYDYNKDGTLENDELSWLLGALKNAAGEDNTLDDSENAAINARFKEELKIDNADFKEFTNAVSAAAEDITDTQEKVLEDGSKELVTYYKDGTTETIGYYPDGGYKYKKTEIPHSVTKYWINAKEVSKDEYEKALKNPPIPSQPRDSIGFYAVNISSETVQIPERKEEFSVRYQVDKLLDSFCSNLETWELNTIKDRFASLIEQYPEQDWIKNLEQVKEVLEKNKLSASFDNVADAFESLNADMTIRNELEWEANTQKREEHELREFAKDILTYVFEIAGAMQQDYHDNQGFADFGFYAERLNDLICKLGGESDFTRSYAQAAKNCASLANKSNNIPTLNDEVFNAEFENLAGGKLNLEGLKKLKELVSKEGFDFQKDIYGKEFNTALKEMLGSSLIEDVQDSMDINSILSGVGDIAVMLMTLGAAAETKAAQIFGKTAMQTFGKASAKLSARAMALSNPVARGTMKFAGKVTALGGGAIVGGTHLAAYTGAKETINNFTNPTRDALSLNTWNATADAMTQSFGFGAFGGVWGQAVTSRLMSAVNRTSSKTMSALAPKFAEGSIKGTDVLKVFLEKSAPDNIAKAMGFASEVIGFTAYESALNLFLHIEGEITLDKVTDVLWEEFKNQGYTLGQIKAISMLLMGSKAARAAQTSALESSFEGLKGVEVIPHPEKNEFHVKLSNGKVCVCKNPNEMISVCMLMARVGTTHADKRSGAKPESRRELEGGIRPEELTEVAPFARRLSPYEVTDPIEILSENLDARANSANFDLTQYETTGLPLKYSRQEFTQKLKMLVNDMKIEDQQKILEKFNINLIYTGEGFELKDIPKIPQDYELKTPLEREIKAEIERFTKENEFEIDNPEMKVFLDDFVQIAPEFLLTVGKQQHGTHAYTLDVHTLKVLQHAIEHPEYQNLSPQDKMVLNTAILLHDIGKRYIDPKTPDESHAENGYSHAISLLDRFNLPSDIKQRVIKLIENHEFFKQYNEMYTYFKFEQERNAENKANYEQYGFKYTPETGRKDIFDRHVQYIAGRFVSLQDITLAKILTYSDLKSVNPEQTYVQNEWNSKTRTREDVEYRGFDKMVTKTQTDAEFKEYIDESLSYVEKELSKYQDGKIDEELVYPSELRETSNKLFGYTSFFNKIERNQNQSYGVHRSDYEFCIQTRQMLIDKGFKPKEAIRILESTIKYKDNSFDRDATLEFLQTYLENIDFIKSHNLRYRDYKDANEMTTEINLIKQKEALAKHSKSLASKMNICSNV